MKKRKQNPNMLHCDCLRTARNIIDDVNRLLWNESMAHHDAIDGSFFLYGMRQSAEDLKIARAKIQEVIAKIEQESEK
jgi:hypothetical protein